MAPEGHNICVHKTARVPHEVESIGRFFLLRRDAPPQQHPTTHTVVSFETRASLLCPCRCFFFFLPQELLDNTALLREQMAGTRALADQEKQEEYLRVKQMEAYERR